MPKTFFGAIAKPGPPPATFTSISLGFDHGVGIRSNSTTWTWGQNDFGQLGNGGTINCFTFTTPTGGLTFSYVNAGYQFTFGITTGGTAYAWGANSSGNLGINSVVSTLTPTAVCGGLSFTQIVGSANAALFAVGLTTTGNAYAWGSGLNGRLGDNSVTSKSTPVAVCGGHNFCKLACGYFHTVAINSVGQAYAWGVNSSGNLGNDQAIDRSTPVAVCGGHNFCEVAAGASLSLAINSSGQAYAWGTGGAGSLGNNSTISSVRTPVAVCGGHTFCKISAGGLACFGLTNTGVLYSWGQNNQGMLGIADGVFHRSTPVPVCGNYTFCSINASTMFAATAITNDGKLYGWGYFCGFNIGSGPLSATPKAFTNGYNFCQLSVYSTTIFFLDSNNVVYSTGSNTNGARGTNDIAGDIISFPKTLSGGFSFSKIASGSQHGCAITTNNVTYCWGVNVSGQLGDNTAVCKCSPVSVVGGLSFNKIACGTNNSYGITTAGVGYSWGASADGALGNNSTTPNRSTPVAVCGGLTFCEISAGLGFAVALTNTGVAYSWGRNSSGQLGDGTIVSKSTPVLVSGGLSFCKISSNNGHTLALTSNGTLYAWGFATTGQLGNNLVSNRSTPVAVCGGYTFCEISAGNNHSCGLTNLGAAYCWGSNASSQLGDNTSGTANNKSTPVAVCGGYTFCKITAGSGVTSAITNTGQVYSWGTNTNYQFGDVAVDVRTPNLITYL
jgi:alpha-tubulin suppressor-like RCC1 family protein